MYLVFPVIVTVIVFLQCLPCSFGQNQKVRIADIIMTMIMTMTMTKSKIQNQSFRNQNSTIDGFLTAELDKENQCYQMSLLMVSQKAIDEFQFQPYPIRSKNQVNMKLRLFWIFFGTINLPCIDPFHTHHENTLPSYATQSFCLFLSVFLQFWYFFSCSANPKCFIAFVEERAIQKEQKQETYNQTQTRDRNG